MEVECRFFATFREELGTKTMLVPITEEATVGDLLAYLESEHPALAGELLTAEGIHSGIRVLKNGRNVTHLDGPDTPLSAGATVSIFPPVAGGDRAEVQRSFRGIPQWLAVEYLTDIGGTPSDDATVVAETWQATIEQSEVSVGPSMTVTELTLTVTGKNAAVQDVIDQFRHKARRAGG